MVKRISLSEAIEIIGHEKGVRNYEVVKALGKSGKFKRATKDLKKLPDICLLRIRWEPGRKHHIVLKSGKIYDPLYEKPAPNFQKWYEFIKKHGGRVVSYFEL